MCFTHSTFQETCSNVHCISNGNCTVQLLCFRSDSINILETIPFHVYMHFNPSFVVDYSTPFIAFAVKFLFQVTKLKTCWFSDYQGNDSSLLVFLNTLETVDFFFMPSVFQLLLMQQMSCIWSPSSETCFLFSEKLAVISFILIISL